jgi:uncharacterized membrane protein YeaQ/YmgE (transglycosylase-associated protein family)
MDKFVSIIEGVFGGVIAYYICNYLVAQLITGTAFADNLFKVFLPIAIGAATLLFVIGTVRTGRHNG